MQEKNMWQRILQRIREWFERLLRLLFPEDILGEIRRAGSGDDRTKEPEDGALSEEERRRMMASPVQRLHVRFTGRVQGVGFRYQAMYAARNAGLTGWVKNLSDGSVEMEVQGPLEAIDYMFLQIYKGRWIRVDRMEKQTLPVVSGERGFQVKGY